MIQQLQANLKQYHVVYSFITIFIVIFVAACIGIFTRPLSYSAFFWPANGILLGILIRYPSFRNVGTFIGATLGYLAADLMTGNTFLLTVVLTVINFIAIYGSYYFYRHFYQRQSLRLNQTFARASFPLLFSTIIGSCFCSVAAIAILPYVPHTFMGQEHQLLSFINWWSGELLNFVMIIPILISFPGFKKLYQSWSANNFHEFQFKDLNILLPFIAVIISCVLTHYYFAPGALFYPLATMMWAAAVYSLYSMSLITTVVCLTLYHSLSSIYLISEDTTFVYPMISIRVGLIILGVTTLYICVMNLHRRKIFKEIEHLAEHDSLTETLNRRKFIQLSESILKRQKNYPIAVMMLDIDHFKKLNDTYGHACGDLALKAFSRVVQSLLRADDLFCRIGGEEFTVFLQQTHKQQALSIAERIRNHISELKIQSPNNEMIGMTLSIGLIHIHELNQFEMQDLLNKADEALYFSKQHGRNQVTLYEDKTQSAQSLERVHLNR